MGEPTDFQHSEPVVYTFAEPGSHPNKPDEASWAHARKTVTAKSGGIWFSEGDDKTLVSPTTSQNSVNVRVGDSDVQTCRHSTEVVHAVMTRSKVG